MASGALLDSTVLQLDLPRLVLTRLAEFDGGSVYRIGWTATILDHVVQRMTRLRNATRTVQEARDEVANLIALFPYAMIDDAAIQVAAEKYFLLDVTVAEGLATQRLSFDDYLMAAAVAGGCDYIVSTRTGPPPAIRQFEPDLPRFSTPDEFLVDVEGVEGAKVRTNLRELQRMTGFHSMSAMLDVMQRCGLYEFCDRLRDMRDVAY